MMTENQMLRNSEKCRAADEYADRLRESILEDGGYEDEADEAYEDAYYTFTRGFEWADKHPFISEPLAWEVYNFINDWKNGVHGEVSLQKALINFKPIQK